MTPAYTAPRTPASPSYGFSSGMGGATAAALAFEKPPEKEVPPRTGSIPPKPDPFAAAAPPAPSGFSNWGSPAAGGADPFAAAGRGGRVGFGRRVDGVPLNTRSRPPCPVPPKYSVFGNGRRRGSATRNWKYCPRGRSAARHAVGSAAGHVHGQRGTRSGMGRHLDARRARRRRAAATRGTGPRRCAEVPRCHRARTRTSTRVGATGDRHAHGLARRRAHRHHGAGSSGRRHATASSARRKRRGGHGGRARPNGGWPRRRRRRRVGRGRPRGASPGHDD